MNGWNWGKNGCSLCLKVELVVQHSVEPELPSSGLKLDSRLQSGLYPFFSLLSFFQLYILQITVIKIPIQDLHLGILMEN